MSNVKGAGLLIVCVFVFLLDILVMIMFLHYDPQIKCRPNYISFWLTKFNFGSMYCNFFPCAYYYLFASYEPIVICFFML